MSEWSPDPNPEPGDDSTPDDEVARVVTLTPVSLRLVAISHPKQAPGHIVYQALGAVEGSVSDDSPVLAQGSLPESIFQSIQSFGLFDAPVPLLLAAQEENGGIRAQLAAIVPASSLARIERASRSVEEPWLASVEPEPEIPSFDPSSTDDEDAVQMVPFGLGVILRFPEDRKHPGKLDEEAMDLLATILSGRAMDADKKRVENLLKSL